MSLFVLFSSWSMGGGGLFGFQFFQGYYSPYLVLKNYRYEKGPLWETKAGPMWFSGGIVGAILIFNNSSSWGGSGALPGSPLVTGSSIPRREASVSGPGTY